MALTPATTDVPLTTDAHGVVRVRNTRVTLESIVTAFRSGATAEGIAQQFPAVPLADVYQVIAYYLQHTPVVEAYLTERQKQAKSVRRQIERRSEPKGIRARLLARKPAAR